MHKCQGMAQLSRCRGRRRPAISSSSRRFPASPRDEKTLFDGVDGSIAGLAQFAGGAAPKQLVDGLSAIASAVQDAQTKFNGETDQSTAPSLVSGLHAVRTLRGQLPAMVVDAAARFDIDFRLRQKEDEFQQALLLADGVRVEALADDGVVVPGQAVKVSVLVANRGAADVSVKQVKFDGFDADAACTLTAVVAGGGRGGRGGAPPPVGPPVSVLKKDTVGRCEPTLRIPGTRGSASPTGTARARRGATPSTPTRRSACRSGRRRSIPR